jgi:GntR family carbon starvation induced transcriptional regulator
MLSLVPPPDKDANGPRSQTSVAYEKLRADILAGRYAPGEKLKIADLAALLEVSPGAVREALSRLVPEQLVVSRDQRGCVVAPLSIDDLEDLTDLRCEIEAIALRRSVANGDAEWEAAVLAAAHRLRRTTMLSPPDHSLTPEWVVRHAAFHAALVGACGSRRAPSSTLSTKRAVQRPFHSRRKRSRRAEGTPGPGGRSSRPRRRAAGHAHT